MRVRRMWMVSVWRMRMVNMGTVTVRVVTVWVVTVWVVAVRAVAVTTSSTLQSADCSWLVLMLRRMRWCMRDHVIRYVDDSHRWRYETEE